MILIDDGVDYLSLFKDVREEILKILEAERAEGGLRTENLLEHLYWDLNSKIKEQETGTWVWVVIKASKETGKEETRVFATRESAERFTHKHGLDDFRFFQGRRRVQP